MTGETRGGSLGQMKIIEFYGGPQIGKSTCAMATALRLKLGHEEGLWSRPVCVEYVPEFATEQVREARMVGGDPRLALENQLRLAGTQLHFLERLAGDGVEVVVCDSPLWLCAIYGRHDRLPSEHWRAVLRAHYGAPMRTPAGLVPIEVLPVALGRVVRPHDLRGRVHNLAQSVALDDDIFAVARAEWGDKLFHTTAVAVEAARAVVAEMLRREWLPR